MRTLHPDQPMYTYWDYMRNRWPRDAGLRLDRIVDQIAARLGALAELDPLGFALQDLWPIKRTPV